MTIHINLVRALKDNYIWIIEDTNSHTAWVVDPGDAAPVISYLREHHLQLAGILITHHHADHSGGVQGLLDEWNDIPVYASSKSKVAQVTNFVNETDILNCGKCNLSVAEIPGHTLDHIAFYNDEMIFCGDTLFSAGCGRVFEGTHEQMYQSLGKLARLNDSAKIYCGHEYTLANLRFAEHVEPQNNFIQEKIKSANQLIEQGKPTLPSLLKDEKNINPFLRCEISTVIEAAQKNMDLHSTDPADIFKSLREWKNNF